MSSISEINARRCELITAESRVMLLIHTGELGSQKPAIVLRVVASEV